MMTMFFCLKEHAALLQNKEFILKRSQWQRALSAGHWWCRLTPNASYNVTLFFTEIYWDGPGLRLFNISANNKTVITDFDIFATAGGNSDCARYTLAVHLTVNGDWEAGLRRHPFFCADSQGTHLSLHVAWSGGRDAACNLTFPVTVGPLAQLQLQFEGVRDQASVAGIQVSGPHAASFQTPSFLQDDSDTNSAGTSRGRPLLSQTAAPRVWPTPTF